MEDSFVSLRRYFSSSEVGFRDTLRLSILQYVCIYVYVVTIHY